METLGRARLTAAAPLGRNQAWSLCFGETLALEVRVETRQFFDDIELGVALSSARGFEVASWTSKCGEVKLSLNPGTNVIRIEYEDLSLLPGQYCLGFGLRSAWGMEDYIADAVPFEVLMNEHSAAVNSDSFAGVIVPNVSLCVQKSSAGSDLRTGVTNVIE
jgi:hypothetical protein